MPSDGSVPALAVHGGAGTINPDKLTPAKAAALRDGLRRALRAGQSVLMDGGGALDAVVAAVSVLEDDPGFNAGHGAVLTRDGRHEMDAAVMDGATGRLGALAGIIGPRNPVQAARLVMERSAHVLLAGAGALAFLQAQGVAFEPEAYFGTPERQAALAAFLASEGGPVDDADKHGTVGAVARDRNGGLAAATSTGGMTGKAPGRIGDTPVAGAGTWADQAVAMSATGHGESFIRAAAGHELSARLRLAGETLEAAADTVLAAVAAYGGTGGLIAVGADGRIVLPFNTRGMYRGMAAGGDAPVVGIFREPLAP